MTTQNRQKSNAKKRLSYSKLTKIARCILFRNDKTSLHEVITYIVHLVYVFWASMLASPHRAQQQNLIILVMYNNFQLIIFYLQKKLESDLNKVNEKIAKTQTALENITPQYESLRDKEEDCTQQYVILLCENCNGCRSEQENLNCPTILTSKPLVVRPMEIQIFNAFYLFLPYPFREQGQWKC